MSDAHEPRLPPRPLFVERNIFDERNDVLFLLLGLVSMAERILSVVPEIVEPPKPEAASVASRADDPARILR